MNSILSKSSLRKLNLRTYTMVFALIVLAIFFQSQTDGIFLNSRNLSNLFRAMSITGVITVGMSMLIISGNFDLAVGSVVGLAGGVAAILQVTFGFGTVTAILVALACGVLVGVWQGFWVAYRKVPSFIVTLGGMLIFRGIYLLLTDGRTIGPLNRSFVAIAQDFLPLWAGNVLGIVFAAIVIVLIFRKRLSRKKYDFENPAIWVDIAKAAAVVVLTGVFIYTLNGFRGVPFPVLILLVLIAVFMFLSKRTRFGRNIYAIGGNQEAARLSGINIELNVMIMYMITGALSALSGILLAGRLDGATPSAGMSFEMGVISACVIGGTSLSGGKGSIFGVVVGALIIASLDNGMGLMDLPFNYQSVVKGLVLIVAVWFDVRGNHKK